MASFFGIVFCELEQAVSSPARTPRETLAGTIAGYRGKDNFPLKFSDLRIAVESEQVGPLKTTLELSMPDGFLDISVPERPLTGFGPKGMQPEWGGPAQ